MKEKPDNVSENPNILPYGSNVGAPAIEINDIQSWKETRVNNVNKQFKDKFIELKKEYEKLIDEYKWNELVYKSKFNFEPVIGNIYHLYNKDNGDIFLSLIGPTQWNKKFIGSFKYNHDNKWIKI
ncbi:MAG: DUF2452 domain-containing protein [Candidatus Kariarchaeum pelagius]